MLDRFERALERLVEGSVAGVFRLRVQPADIGRRLERAMLDGRMTSVGAILAPNHCDVQLHPEDAAVFAGWEDALCHEMEAWLAELAYSHGLATVGPLRVQIEADSSVTRRSIRASSRFVDSGANSQRTSEYRPTILSLVSRSGEAAPVPLSGRSVTVGRAAGNDVMLAGAEISRRHARLEPDNAGRGWQVVDLGSTNGTWVNGVRVERAAIAAGDVVAFAQVSFECKSMIERAIEQLIAEGWVFAALRILFIGLIYLFLFLVLRSTVRELALVAMQMNQGEGRASEVRLLVLDPAQSTMRQGEVLTLQPITEIGRDATSTIIVDDPYVSAKHAGLRFERGQWWLRDLGSSNGTILNGEPVRSVVGVRAGDVIQCAGVRFRLIPSFPVPGEDASA